MTETFPSPSVVRSSAPAVTKKIIIEANIGCGKTTLLSKLEKNTALYDIVVEPIDNWTNVGGHNLLKLLYSDPQRWSFAFQSCAQMSMAKSHRLPSNNRFKIMESSIYGARYCFTENFRRGEMLHDAEYELLNQFFLQMIQSGDCNVDLIIYLQSTPELCLDRVHKRNRPEEQTTVDLPFLTALHNLYEQWLITKSPYIPCAPVVIIDASKNDDDVFTEVDTYLKALLVCDNE